MAKAKKKSAKEASNTFHNIMAASVKGNPAPKTSQMKKSVIIPFEGRRLVFPYKVETNHKGDTIFTVDTTGIGVSDYFKENLIGTLKANKTTFVDIAFANDTANKLQRQIYIAIFTAEGIEYF